MNLLEKEQTYTLPIIAPQSLGGNQPTNYNALQRAILPHVDQIAAFWWVVWVVVFCVLVFRGIRRFMHNFSK